MLMQNKRLGSNRHEKRVKNQWLVTLKSSISRQIKAFADLAIFAIRLFDFRPLFLHSDD